LILTENTTSIFRRNAFLHRGSFPIRNGVRVRKYLPLEFRVRLRSRVSELAKLPMSYQQIQTEIFDSTHVWLSKGSISEWIRGIHDPSGGANKFRVVASPELAYVIGVIAGDGNLNVHGYNYEMLLSVTDRDFAEEFSRCLAKILGKSNLYKVRWSEKRKRWIVQGSSIFLHRFLIGGWQRLKRYIEHCYGCRASFLRALFDGEGTIGQNRISIYNTDLRLIQYVRSLLSKSGIETRNPYVRRLTGSILKDPRTGILYERRKDCYTLTIGAAGCLQFARHVGFAIQRKNRLLPSLRVSQFEKQIFFWLV
jgi:intein-encoded DNA endonuclease-like protein